MLLCDEIFSENTLVRHQHSSYKYIKWEGHVRNVLLIFFKMSYIERYGKQPLCIILLHGGQNICDPYVLLLWGGFLRKQYTCEPSTNSYKYTKLEEFARKHVRKHCTWVMWLHKILKSIRVYTLRKNLINASSVLSSWKWFLKSKYIIGHILGRNHIDAVNVKRLSQ